MRKLLMTAVLAGVTFIAPGLSPQAQASHDWLDIGAVFRVGAARIAFALGRPVYGYEPAYYYRYDEPIRYRGHSCSRYCFHDAGYDYHHESCPLVAAHFSHYRVDRRWAFDRYAPRHRGNYRGDHGYRDGYDRHDRYDHRGSYDRYDHGSRYRRDDNYRGYRGRDRYDRHDRYDGDRGRDHRGRGRGHRHHKGCGH